MCLEGDGGSAACVCVSVLFLEWLWIRGHDDLRCMKEEEEEEDVYDVSGPRVNKRNPRCRGSAGSMAPPARKPCFHQSVTVAPCPPHWSAAPCPFSAQAADCQGTPWRTRPRGRTQTCRRISHQPPGNKTDTIYALTNTLQHTQVDRCLLVL